MGKTIRIYVSGTYTAQERLRGIAEELTRMGHRVDANWLKEVQKPDYLTEEQFYKARGIEDLVQTAAADCIILDNDGDSTSGGRYTEWGVAIAPGSTMLKIWVGQSRKGVFSHLADYYFPTWAECLDFLRTTRIGR